MNVWRIASYSSLMGLPGSLRWFRGFRGFRELKNGYSLKELILQYSIEGWCCTWFVGVLFLPQKHLSLPKHWIFLRFHMDSNFVSSALTFVLDTFTNGVTNKSNAISVPESHLSTFMGYRKMRKDISGTIKAIPIPKYRKVFPSTKVFLAIFICFLASLTKDYRLMRDYQSLLI